MSSNSSASTGIGAGYAVGVAIAVQISWGLTHSIGWAILHGFLAWIYVIYHWIIGKY